MAKHPKRPAPAPPPRVQPAAPAPLPPRVQPLALRPTKQFKPDVERMKKRGKDIAKLQSIINSLVQRNPLEPQYRDHALTGELKGSRDCHVEPDWILIYEQKLDELILFRTGSHSDLFSLSHQKMGIGLRSRRLQRLGATHVSQVPGSGWPLPLANVGAAQAAGRLVFSMLDRFAPGARSVRISDSHRNPPEPEPPQSVFWPFAQRRAWRRAREPTRDPR